MNRAGFRTRLGERAFRKRRGDRAVGGYQDDGELRVDFLDAPEEVEPVHPLELEASDDAVDVPVRENVERFLAAVDIDHFGTQSGDFGADGFSGGLLVGDQ